MIFKPYASGSSGNMYTISDGDTRLILDAGLKTQEIKRALNFNISDVKGVLISHSHSDHAKGVKGLLKMGIDCYMTKQTAKELNLRHHRLKIIEPRKQFKIGSWTILPFELEHDVENVGYLIQDYQNTKLLYATDTYYIRYKFKGVNIIAVECNYDEEILNQNILDGITPVAQRKRLRKSHFNLSNFKEFIKANDLSRVQEIWLLHLSNRNSDEALFKKEIQSISGKPVYIA